MSTTLYDNANVLANVVSVTAAAMQEISGNEVADLSSLQDQNALPNLIAAKLQSIVAPLLISNPLANS